MSTNQNQGPGPEWWNSINILMSVFKMIVMASVLFILYATFGQHLIDALAPSPVMEAKQNYRSAEDDDDWDKVENGIHVQTGLIFDRGFDQVRANCTVCHSAKLITQNRANREGWSQMITWMQETQGLWELGPSRVIILDYLAKHYAPEQKGRRENLNIAEIEWYILDLQDNQVTN